MFLNNPFDGDPFLNKLFQSIFRAIFPIFYHDGYLTFNALIIYFVTYNLYIFFIIFEICDVNILCTVYVVE